MLKNQQRDNRRALIVEKIAEKHGLKRKTVYAILRGDRNNEDVMDDYITMSMEVENLLLKAVKKAVPFHQINENQYADN